MYTVADPGFPIGGGVDLMGGHDSRGGYVSKILYVETKESGSLGGVRLAHPLDPPMVNNTYKMASAVPSKSRNQLEDGYR